MEIREGMHHQHTGSRHINIPIFIPHLGCPNTCVFCDQHRISGADRPVSIKDIKRIIEGCVSTSSGEDELEAAFFGGSFTGIPRSQMLAYLETAKEYLDKGLVSRIRISTRPDYIDQEILGILKRFGVGIIELGVQSMDEDVLARSKRGHTAEDVNEAVEKIKGFGFELGIQIMPGLPGDTFEKSLKTAEKVVSLSPSQVRIYPAIVLKATEMEEMVEEGFYQPLTLEEAVTWCARMVPLFRRAGIRIIRMGLHYSDLLKDAVVAGPFHPAFGEMVESRVILNQIMELIEDNSLEGCTGIEIYTWKGAMSKTLGHKRDNIKFLKKKYGYGEVRVRESDLLSGHIRVLSKTKEIGHERDKHTADY